MLSPINEIEYIEITNGSESVLYGDQAVGGAINIITRRNIKDAVNASCSLGSYNLYQCNASIFHHYQALKFNMTALNSHTDNYRDHNDYDQNLVSGRFDYAYPLGRLIFDYNIGNEDMQYPGALTAAQVREDRTQSSNDINFFKDWNGFFRLQHEQILTDNWRLETQLARRVMHGHGVLYSDFTQSRTTDFIKPQIKGKIKNAVVIGGVDFQNDSYNINSMLGNTSDAQRKYSVFGIANMPVHDTIALSIGARAAQQNSRLESLSINNNINRAFATTLGATWQAMPDIAFYLRRAESFRFPKADENASTSPGSTGLRTQRGVSYEAGSEWERENSLAKIGIYQLNLRDEITFDPTQTPEDPFGTNRNLSPTVRRGVTISGKQALTHRLSLDGQYNYVNARFQDGVNSGKRIPLVSDTIARAGLNYHIADHWNIYTEGVYTGNQYAANDDANVAGANGGYTSYNFHLRYLYQNLTASFRVNNIFNKYYYFYTVYQSSMNSEVFYPAPGRNIVFTVNYLFG